MPNFRLNAKNFFLTYPQCPLPINTLVTKLSGLRPATYVLVSSEQHADGTPHLHALLCLVDKYNCRNERFFDVTCEGRTYHPNLQAVRNLNDVRTYIIKDGNFVEQGEFVDPGKRKR